MNTSAVSSHRSTRLMSLQSNSAKTLFFYARSIAFSVLIQKIFPRQRLTSYHCIVFSMNALIIGRLKSLARLVKIVNDKAHLLDFILECMVLSQQAMQFSETKGKVCRKTAVYLFPSTNTAAMIHAF